MSDHQKLKETLSALFDNEAGKVDQLELRRLARALEDNPDLVETYQRYALSHAVLSGDRTYSSSSHLFTNVRAALEKEEMEEAPSTPALLPSNSGERFNWLKAAGRVAIAASVAVIAIYVVQRQSPATDLPQPAQLVANNQAQPVTTGALTQLNNRILNPQVINVSVGDRPSFEQVGEQKGALPVGCVLGIVREDGTDLVWQKELPAGYALCKKNEQTKNCEAVSSKIGCYLN